MGHVDNGSWRETFLAGVLRLQCEQVGLNNYLLACLAHDIIKIPLKNATILSQFVPPLAVR